MEYHTITTTNLSVVGSGPIWAPGKKNENGKPEMLLLSTGCQWRLERSKN